MLFGLDPPAPAPASHHPFLSDDDGGRKARVRGGSSQAQAAVAFVKAVVGGGIFALPSAVRASGLALGVGVVLVMAALSWYTTQACINCVNALRARGVARKKDGRIEYTHLTEHAYPWIASPMTFLCALCQLGSVVSYFAFVGANIAPMMPWLEYWHVVLGMAAIVGPLALLRETSHPAFGAAMAFGNGAIVLAVGSVLYYGAEQWSQPRIVLVDERGLGLLFGVSLVMFSAHMEMVSIEQARCTIARTCSPSLYPTALRLAITPVSRLLWARIEQDMARREAVYSMLRWAFGGLTLAFAAFGGVVYVLFGEGTGRVRDEATGGWVEATIMNNLNGGTFLQFVQVCMSLNLAFMCPITLLPASKAIEEALGIVPQLGWPDMAPAHALRLTVVALVTLTACLLPDFELITGVMGSFGAIMCFLLPSLCHLKFCGDGMGAAERALNHAIAALGVVGFFFSLYLQISQAVANRV